MKRKFTKLIAALALLVFMMPSLVAWGQTTVASYSRSGTTNTITGGEFTTTFSAKTGYYQDNSGDCYMQILSTDAYWTTTPTSISFAASIGGGSGNKDLTNPVYVSLLDANGDVITNTQTTVTSYITTNTGDSYEITMPVVNNVYGVKLSHEKETGYNVRYYSFSLSYVANGGSTPPTPTTYTVTFDAGDGTFVGNTDFPNASNTVEAGTYILPSATPATGYTFNKWNIGDQTYDAGASYTVSSNADFVASYTQNGGGTGGDDHWVLTELADLTADDVFVIVGNNGSNYAMSNDKGTSNPPVAVAVTVTGNEITSTVAANLQWNISGNATDGYTFYPNGSTTTWLYCTATNNGVRVGTNEANTFKMEASSGYLVHQGTSRYIGIYSSQDWRCYTSINTNIQNQTFAFYKKVTGGTLPPSITANNVEIEYDAEEGNIVYTINNEPDPVGTMTAAIKSGTTSTITNLNFGTSANNAVPFTCDANTDGTARTATVTLTYTYDTDQTVTRDVTITQAGNPNVVDDISDITGAGDYHVKGMVVATSNKGFIIGDGTGYVYTYMGNTSFDYEVGDNLSITGTTSTNYGNVIQFTDAASIETVEETNYNGEPQPEVITAVPNYSTGNHLSTYLQFEGTLSKVTSGNYTNYNIAVGEGTIRISYPTDDQVSELEDLLTKKVRVHGFFAGNSGATFTALMESVEEVVTLEPTVTVTPATINAPFAGADGTLAITYENIPGLYDFDYYFCDAEGTELLDTDPAYPGDWIYAEIHEDNGEYSMDYIIDANDGEARTAYIKVYFEEYFAIVTINQAQYVIDYATLPFEWAGGLPTDFDALNGTTLNSVGSYPNQTTYQMKLDEDDDYIQVKCDQQPGIVTIGVKMVGGNSTSYITVQGSADGETFTNVETLTISGAQNSTSTLVTTNAFASTDRYVRLLFTKGSNVGVGPISIAVYEEPVPAITVESTTITATAAETEGTLNVTYTAIETDLGVEIHWFETATSVEPLSAAPEWIDADLNSDLNVDYLIEENSGEVRTAYFKVYGVDAELHDIYSELVTVTQAAYVPPTPTTTYTLATTIVSGKHYIIASGVNGSVKAMGSQSTNNRAAVDVIANNGTISEATDAYEFVIIGPDADSYYTIYDVENEKYLNAAGTGSANYLKLQDPINDRGRWTITFSEDAAVITAKTTDTDRKIMRYNNGSTCFSCYGTGQNSIYLFAKDNETASSYTYEDLSGFGDDNTVKTGWHLIATPVGQMTPSMDNNFLSDNTFDLYYFDQSAENGLVWKNYKANSFDLVSGHGYLYANSETVDLTFEGMPYVGNGQVCLAYDEVLADDEEYGWLAGWNLIGNPFGTTATLPNTVNYYTLNEDGSELITGDAWVFPAMEGLFVQATNTGESVTFTPQSKGGVDNSNMVALNLNGDGGVIDRVIVRFDENRALPKFMLDSKNTKLYIPQGGKDYAVVNSDAQGEMPVNFKAAKNGSYTISVDAKNLDVNYLHLIDNMTGMNIDLLATPSYTFEANTDDYAYRFRLVFSANNVNDNEGNESFAFMGDGNLMILGIEGEATLQMVDVTGRILSSETFSGSYNKTVSARAGVYMLRLIQDENVRTQKIIVK